MAQLYVYFCLLSALRTVMTLTFDGGVGRNLTFRCSNWNVLNDVKENVKYFCRNPCKQIIVKAGFKKSKRKDRIEIVNSAEGLFVTFFNLQESDSGKYYCGVERFGWDSYIEVDLTVKDAKPSRPKKTPETVSDMETTSPSASTNGSTVFTDMPTTNETLNMTTSIASASHGAGSVPYLVIGGIVTMTSLMVLLKIMRNMKKKQERVISRAHMPQDDVESVDYEEIRHEDQQSVRQSQRLTCLYDSVDQQSVYANCSSHQNTELEAQADNMYSNDPYLNQASTSRIYSKKAFLKNRVTDLQGDCLYSVAQPPKQRIKPVEQFELNRSDSNENDSLYSLAQLPQTT
ncbi:CMRF35-like molecule 5 [Xyrichtys novacula]|uniref:CMRF35-like molecule 5 n=1 Tax=Xyrichtys novacula TaxID=13765 RepID=A0AAV1EV29_XYRNO|nr:CMRF35-like molecule 5 [Xyrichtys novacula]